MIIETDVSILIPSYKRPEMTAKAVKSALATGAGEIIVSEDDPNTDIAGFLKEIRDERLKVYKQPQTLGLWKNHYFLLKLATKPWIKFLQTDDFIVPECIAKMCEAVTEKTAIVSALPIRFYINTSVTKKIEVLEKPYTWSSAEYLQRLKRVGNELSRPSNTLIKTEYLEQDETAWENDKSADLIMNVMAASKGDVVLLSEGLVYIGIHPAQDTYMQSFQLIQRRLRNSLDYLRSKNIKEINAFVNAYGFIEMLGLFRIMLSYVKHKKTFYYKGLTTDLLSITKNFSVATLVKERGSIVKYYKCKFHKDKDIVTVLK